MNTYIFVDPRFRPLDLSGDIMPGSYLQFFESETDTPTPVYSDAALTTEIGVEVEADGAGRFEVMYMDPEVIYRAKLFDADDVLQWDVDPYTPPRDYQPRTVIMFFGTAEQRDEAYPTALWQVCDGSNGSPDMRDRFPVGVSGSKALGDTGGQAMTITEMAGAHDHGAATGETLLDETNMPVHNHRLYVRNNSSQEGNTRGFGFANTAGLEGQVTDYGSFGYVDTAPAGGANTLVEETGEAVPTGHDHEISEQADHQHDITGDGLPPWLALWFLMRKVPS